MLKPKRIFVVADFNDESPKSIRMQQRMWTKGLVRLGHDVQRFSFRNIMMQCSPFPSKRIARLFGKRKANSLLVEQVVRYHPDIIFVLSMKYLDAESVTAMRGAVAKAVFVGRDEDPFPEKNPARIAIAQQMDVVTTTSSGRFLRTYKDAGVPRCAFIPNMCDPDIQRRYAVEERWKTDIVFTGKAEHTRLERNDERYDLVRRLSLMPSARLYGCFGIPRAEGIEAFYAISGARIALSINIANDVRLYHSDRFINYIACGTFTLAKRVPDTELLFEEGKHVKYFDTADEFFERAQWYLEHDNERERIAANGMKHAHREFNCTRIAGLVMDLIVKGSYDASWAVVL